MRCILVLGLCLALSGCGAPSAMIKSDTVAFDDIIEDTTNKLLLLNILRARDKAPLHFADIPSLRESIQQTASFSFLNFLGRLANTTARDSMSIGANIQLAPSFEITHLQSKEFNTGIASPIDPKFVKYWLDRGLDRRIVLLMFFSAAEIIETSSENGPKHTIKIMNSPRDAIDVITGRKQAFSGADKLRCDTQSDFERYLKLLNTLSTFFANSYRERRLIAKGLKFDLSKDGKLLQDFATLDPAKAQLVYDKGQSTYNLYALAAEPRVAFCFHEGNEATAPSSPQYEYITTGPASPTSKNTCFQSVVEVQPEDSTRTDLNATPIFFPQPALVREPSRYCGIYNRFTGTEPVRKVNEYPKLELKLHIRSVGEIFQFLGDLLQYQDEIQKHLDQNREVNLKINTPVTFGYCGDNPTPGCDDIFIRLDDDPCNARFTLTYRDKLYSVANFSHSGGVNRPNICRSDYVARRDHTLEVLSVLHQLVGLNKSATDIRSTPFVQVVP
jgi:hypothetical protein